MLSEAGEGETKSLGSEHLESYTSEVKIAFIIARKELM